jgi:DHA2 family multidrug resistance protein
MIDQQAYTRAADDVFMASAYIFIGLIAFIWMTKRPAPLVSAPGGPGAPDAGGAH